MNIIICGAGRVGSTIAKSLSEQNHSITVIDQSSDDIQKINSIIKESLKKDTNYKFDLSEKNFVIPLKKARENFEKTYLSSQLKKFKGNISKTADFVGMERSALHRKLKTLGIKGIN